MTTLYWNSTTSGNWEDRSRWSIGFNGPPAAAAPSAVDRVIFHPHFYGDCQLNTPATVADLYAGPFQDAPGSCEGCYYGRINFNGKNFTSRGDIWIGDATSIIGMSGTTWTVDTDLIIDNGLDANGHPKSCYYSFWTPPLTGTYRNLNMASPWRITIVRTFGRGSIYRSSLSNVISQSGTPTLPGCGPTGGPSDTTDYPYYKGVTAYFSQDLGGNTNTRFCPAPDPDPAYGEIMGEAFLEGDIALFGVMAFRIDGEIMGEAFLEGDIFAIEPLILESISGEIMGEAFLEGAIRATVPLGFGGGSGYVGGNRNSSAAGYQCQISSLGPLNFLNQNAFRLTVGNTIVNFSEPYWQMGDLQVDYNGKILTFTEVATPSYSRPSFNNETQVTLQMDLGSGLQTFFRGKIKNRVHHGETHNESIQYTAFGLQNLAQELDDYGPWGITDDSFLGPWPVSVVAERIFQNNAANLALNGIPATIGVPDQNTFTTWTISELSLRNSQFLSGMQQALKTEPSKRVFFDDLQGSGGKWCFPDLETTNFVDLDIDLVNVDPNDFTVDTKNRWTAIKVYVPFEFSVDVEQTGSIEMTPGWDPSYEADWNIRRGMGLDGAQVLGDAYRWVFRRWTFDTGNIQTETGGPLTALFLVPYWSTTRWIPIQGDIDLANGVFISKVPLICKGNPHRTESPKIGPYAAALVYIDTESQPLPAVAWQRIPASGYTGTAYDWFGIQREKQLIVEPNAFAPFQSLEAYAQRKLDVLKDVILTTEFPIVGDPIPELINLQAQVIIKDSSRGLESVPGFLSKYTYTFGKPGKSVLSLSTDRSLVTRTD